jgi:16S rRNA processing protein RimM
MTAPPPFAEMVAIGRVVKPQGRKGEVLVHPLSDRPERFPALREVHVPGPGGTARALEVVSCWPHKGRFVLKLRGIDSIDEAETLRGMDVRIAEGELPALPAGSYYHHQLKGLAAFDEAGAPMGTVQDILETGGEAPVLTVRAAGTETLIPLAEAFVREVDLARGRIVLVRPQYLEAAR